MALSRRWEINDVMVLGEPTGREASLYFRWFRRRWAERLITTGAVITPATIESLACEHLLEYVPVVRSDLAWNEERERLLLRRGGR